jgi:hypothetical protein
MSGQELFNVLIGGIGVFFAMILALLTIARRFVGWMKAAMLDTLLDTGLIKRGEAPSIWPNGSDNLPDFLHHLWAADLDLAEIVAAIDHAVNGVDPLSGDQSMVRNVQDMHDDRDFEATSPLVVQIAEQLAVMLKANEKETP